MDKNTRYKQRAGKRSSSSSLLQSIEPIMKWQYHPASGWESLLHFRWQGSSKQTMHIDPGCMFNSHESLATVSFSGDSRDIERIMSFSRTFLFRSCLDWSWSVDRRPEPAWKDEVLDEHLLFIIDNTQLYLLSIINNVQLKQVIIVVVIYYVSS